MIENVFEQKKHTNLGGGGACKKNTGLDFISFDFYNSTILLIVLFGGKCNEFGENATILLKKSSFFGYKFNGLVEICSYMFKIHVLKIYPLGRKFNYFDRN